MSSNTYVETEHSSWFKRLSESCQGIVFGILIGMIGIGLLIWNEGNSVRQHKVYDEGIRIVVPVNNISFINHENDGKLIHITGMIQNGGDGGGNSGNLSNNNNNPSDIDFGINAPTAIKLKRTTEMYQWIEHIQTDEHKEVGGSTTTTKTYTYSKEWQSNVVSSNFYHDSDKYQNPTIMMYPSKEMVAQSIQLGAYDVSHSVIIGQCNWFVPFDLDNNSMNNIPDPNLRSRTQLYRYSNQQPYFYLGKDPLNPQIGDVRIRYTIVQDQMISVIARQVSGTFTTFVSPTNSGTILLVEQGIHDPYEMFLHAHEQLTLLTWLLRLVGTILLFVMFQLVTTPLVVVADFIPLMGNCLQMGTSFISAILAFIVSIIIIAIAWLVYRPIVSLILFGIAGGVACIFIRHRSYSRIRRMDNEHNAFHNPNQYESIPVVVPEYERNNIIYEGCGSNDYDSTKETTSGTSSSIYPEARVISVHNEDNTSFIPVANMVVTPTAPFEDC